MRTYDLIEYMRHTVNAPVVFELEGLPLEIEKVDNSDGTVRIYLTSVSTEGVLDDTGLKHHKFDW